MTDRYAVIGNPIGHSKSPLIHAAFAKATGQDLEYTAIESPLDGFADTVRAFRGNGGSGGKGMNITVPFKLQAFELADVRSERARMAGAVNCFKFVGERIHAENFDGIGLVHDIHRILGSDMRGKRVLLLGAGGAARGVLLPFLDQQPAELVVANRDAEKARQLVAELGERSNLRAGSYGDIGGARFDIVVNATSASLTGELPPIAPTVFAPDGLAYELLYGKGLTPFLRLARSAGTKQLADGVGMLVEQAAEAFMWWRGVRPDTQPMIDKLTVPLT